VSTRKVVPDKGSSLQPIPKGILFFLSNQPLWPGEIRDEYMALLSAIAGSCGAGDDALKWLLTDKLTHQVWEMRRLRKIEAGILTEAAGRHHRGNIQEYLRSSF
jgi:hypothetical protein